LKPLAQAISWTLMMGASGAYAATITVDTNVDEVVGTTLGTCTLREAVQAANTNLAVANCGAGDAGPDEIQFNTGLGTITLSQGEIVVTTAGNPLTITGPVAGQTVSGNDLSRIFNSSVDLSLTNMTLTNGYKTGTSGNRRGGAINTGGSANLTLTDSTVQNSAARNGGGGISIEGSGTLTLASSTISGNSSQFGKGCGIYASNGTVDIDDSIISSNNCNAQGGGVVINSNSTTTTIDNTTFSDNGHLSRYGGGISTRGTVTITDSTFTGNIASHGGGIGVESGTTNVINTTFS
ncbi:MAG: CSLREA domain-containing protein, partial [Sulfitobacter sp.]|nr:CSLREA domain-containing protein [Sulfitobacter sp.]